MKIINKDREIVSQSKGVVLYNCVAHNTVNEAMKAIPSVLTRLHEVHEIVIKSKYYKQK